MENDQELKKRPNKETQIREAMKSAGTWDPIYEPQVKELAKLKRELGRAEKAWRAAYATPDGKKTAPQMIVTLIAKDGTPYSTKDPYYCAVEKLRKEIASQEQQLGLTPKSAQRLRDRKAASDAGGPTRIEELLDAAHDYALAHAAEWTEEVDAFVDAILAGPPDGDYAPSFEADACEEARQGCRRYREDLASGRWDYRTELACELIAIIETTICHQKGQFLDATPLRGTPFLLLPYHKYCIFNLFGFFIKGTEQRRFKEGLIFEPRKNIKTTFAAALCWALALVERRSGATIYEVGAALKQALEGYDFLAYNMRRLGISIDRDPNGLRLIDNNMEHSISGDVGDGFISYNALASSPEKQDSFNASIILADECHQYKSPLQYQVLKDATSAFTNKLVLGISSGGARASGFLAKHVTYCKGILDKTITGAAADEMFIFVAKAPDDVMESDAYTDPHILAGCNPGWGQSIRPQELINTAQRAHDDPQLRLELFQKRMNLFTAALKAWFDVAVWRRSDEKYNWTPEQLAKLPVRWYGGSDLSRLHDLTATCLFGNYNGVDIIIPHCWFPRTAAIQKADEDHIPLFGWLEDGWLSMSNDNAVNHAEAVKWYAQKRAAGHDIRMVVQDRKFAKEYCILMKYERFRIKDMPQTDVAQTAGFRYLDNSARNGTLYYCHAEPVEYCVGNVRAIERGSVVHFEKMGEKDRIDVFDAAVFACSAYLDDLEKGKLTSSWFGEETESA